MIAAMAESRLTTTTLLKTRAILGGRPLAAVSVWADVVRRDRPATAPGTTSTSTSIATT